MKTLVGFFHIPDGFCQGCFLYCTCSCKQIITNRKDLYPWNQKKSPSEMKYVLVPD